MTQNQFENILIGADRNRRDKSLAQCMEALRAGNRNERSRVRLSGLPRTEAGLPWHRPPGQV